MLPFVGESGESWCAWVRGSCVHSIAPRYPLRFALLVKLSGRTMRRPWCGVPCRPRPTRRKAACCQPCQWPPWTRLWAGPAMWHPLGPSSLCRTPTTGAHKHRGAVILRTTRCDVSDSRDVNSPKNPVLAFVGAANAYPLTPHPVTCMCMWHVCTPHTSLSSMHVHVEARLCGQASR